MTLTKEDEAALLSECDVQWERQRKLFWRVYLPSQEWEDIKSQAVARVLRKAHLYRPAKGDVPAWVGTVIRRVMINAFRRSLPSIPEHKDRTALQHALPIEVRVVRSRHGDERVVVAPDQPSCTSFEQRPEFEEFRSLLSVQERKMVDLLLAGRSFHSACLKLKVRNRDRARKALRSIGARWGAFREGRAMCDMRIIKRRPKLCEGARIEAVSTHL